MSHQTHYRSYWGTGFYGSKDPTNSDKALKEDRVLRIRLHSHQFTSLCYNIIHMQLTNKNTKYTHINTHKSKALLSKLLTCSVFEVQKSDFLFTEITHPKSRTITLAINFLVFLWLSSIVAHCMLSKFILCFHCTSFKSRQLRR